MAGNGNPVDELYNLSQDEKDFLNNPEKYNFRSEPVVEEIFDRQIGDESHKFQADILNENVALLSHWDAAEYTFLEQGDDYSLFESSKHVNTDAALPEETSVYYLVTDEDTFQYNSGDYRRSPIRVPEVFDKIELEEMVGYARNSPTETDPLNKNTGIDVPEVETTGRTVPVEENSPFSEK